MFAAHRLGAWFKPSNETVLLEELKKQFPNEQWSARLVAQYKKDIHQLLTLLPVVEARFVIKQMKGLSLLKESVNVLQRLQDNKILPVLLASQFSFEQASIFQSQTQINIFIRYCEEEAFQQSLTLDGIKQALKGQLNKQEVTPSSLSQIPSTYDPLLEGYKMMLSSESNPTFG